MRPSDRWGWALTGFGQAARSPPHAAAPRPLADGGRSANALSFTTSRQLFDAYWDRKEQDSQQQRPANPPRFATVIGALAEVMSERQRLVVPNRSSTPTTCTVTPRS